MNLPSTNTDSAFDRFLQELPQDYWDLAIEFKAFTRARKINSPAQSAAHLAARRVGVDFHHPAARAPGGRAREQCCPFTASSSRPRSSSNGRDDVVARIGIGSIGRAGPPPGGCGNCCTKRWPSPSAAY
jgi:hypothetical protein